MAKLVNSQSSEELGQLISVSRLLSPATTWIRGGYILNVYSGEVNQAHIALYRDRIAYVGQKKPFIDKQTKIICAEGFTLVPGYIEPHAHSWQIYNPLTLGEFALSHGTTTMIHDNLPFYIFLKQKQLENVFDTFKNMPIKNYWTARLDPQVKDQDVIEIFTKERIQKTLKHPMVLQAGELTHWYELISGDKSMLAKIWLARKENKRLIKHNTGPYVDTITHT